MKFLVENGAKQEDVEKAWKSLAVQQKLNQARDLFNASQLDGVPGFIVDGKYVIGADNNYPRLFDKLNTLATKNAAKTEEAKPVDTAKAEEAKPADASKAEESKPADAAKTEEAKPAAEEKPAETKPAA